MPHLSPRSELGPDFPGLLLGRLLQEHVDEQDAAPPGDRALTPASVPDSMCTWCVTHACFTVPSTATQAL